MSEGRKEEGGNGRRELRMLSVRLPMAVHDFLVEEGYELAIEDGSKEERVKRKAGEIREALKTGKRRRRGPISFTGVLGHALEVLKTFGQLPAIPAARLQRDHEALREVTPGGHLSRFQYVQRVLAARSEEVARKGPGFDKEALTGGGN